MILVTLLNRHKVAPCSFGAVRMREKGTIPEQGKGVSAGTKLEIILDIHIM